MQELEIRLLHDCLVYSAQKNPEKTAIVDEGHPCSYHELYDASMRLAAALKQRGVARGDRVAIFMDNTVCCSIAIFSVLLAGGVFLVINPQTKAEKLAYILDDSDANIILIDRHLGRTAEKALTHATKVKRVIATESAMESWNVNIPVEDMRCVISSASPLQSAVPVIPLDLAALIYTSGSTGNPKGVMMTHLSMVFAVGSLVQYLRLSSDHRIINVLPLAFDYGLYQLFMAIRIGASLVLERSFAFPAQIINRMHEQAVSVFPGVPTIFSTLVSMHRRAPIRFPEVLRVSNTAADLPVGYTPLLKEIFPNALLFRMYGLTECKRVCYLEPELVDVKPKSVGKAIPGTEAFLLSQDGSPVPAGQPGILHVRGPHVMCGYWKQPELSGMMLRDGPYPYERVLCTQDWFRMDDEGYLYFLGRSDDIIKTRGEKVSPVEVENSMYGIPGIKEVAVIGVPDENLGQVIYAYVALHNGVSLSEQEIKRICSLRLETFMVPKKIIFIEELPKTATGKIRKKDLRREAC